jgi:hypothetical protein
LVEREGCVCVCLVSFEEERYGRGGFARAQIARQFGGESVASGCRRAGERASERAVGVLCVCVSVSSLTGKFASCVVNVLNPHYAGSRRK